MKVRWPNSNPPAAYDYFSPKIVRYPSDEAAWVYHGYFRPLPPREEAMDRGVVEVAELISCEIPELWTIRMYWSDGFKCSWEAVRLGVVNEVSWNKFVEHHAGARGFIRAEMVDRDGSILKFWCRAWA